MNFYYTNFIVKINEMIFYNRISDVFLQTIKNKLKIKLYSWVGQYEHFRLSFKLLLVYYKMNIGIARQMYRILHTLPVILFIFSIISCMYGAVKY